MRLTFLGTGDPFGSGGRFQSCLVLETKRTACLVDCGASSLIAMKRFGVDPAGIRTIVISHLHGDHFGGLPFFILDAQFRRRTTDLAVVGPAGTGERVQAAMEVLFPGSARTARRFTVTFSELRDRAELLLDGLSVTPFQVVHPSGAPPFALRLSADGQTLAYSGDTQWTEALVDVARDADVFVCEAYAFDKPIKYHLDYQTLARRRGDLRCRRLILTHMSPEMLNRLPGLEAESAADGMSIDL